MSTLFYLQKLQQIDREIQESKARLGEILRSKQDPKSLIKRRATVDTLTRSIHSLKGQLKDEELQLGSVSDKLNQSQQKLYSGEVKNPKALQDLELESEALTRRQTVLEDHMLETMTSLETDETSFAEHNEALKSEEKGWVELLNKLEQDQSQIANRINNLLTTRQDQAAKIDQATLRDYEALLKSKNGLAVAQVVNDICQGCQVSQTSAVLRALNNGEMVKCPTCYRILFKNY